MLLQVFSFDDEFLQVHLDFAFFITLSSHYKRLHILDYIHEYQRINQILNTLFTSDLVHIYR